MKLYRFEKLEHLLDMLQEGHVAFAHPSQWQDPYESAFLNSGQFVRHGAVLGPDGKYHSGLPRFAHSTTANIGMINPFGNLVFAQCFGERPESERTWNAFRHERRVRWSIDSEHYLDAVRRAIGNRFISLNKVDYPDDAEVHAVHQKFVEKYGRGMSIRLIDEWSAAVTKPLSIKRRGFWDDGEHRFIVVDSKHLREHVSASGPVPVLPTRQRFWIDVQMRELIADVLLPPDCKPTGALTIAAQIRGAGYSGPIMCSTLYAKPNFNIEREKPVTEP